MLLVEYFGLRRNGRRGYIIGKGIPWRQIINLMNVTSLKKGAETSRSANRELHSINMERE